MTEAQLILGQTLAYIAVAVAVALLMAWVCVQTEKDYGESKMNQNQKQTDGHFVKPALLLCALLLTGCASLDRQPHDLDGDTCAETDEGCPGDAPYPEGDA